MTMLLPAFDLHLPTTVDEVVALIAEHGADNVDLLAGGSDLLCNYKWGLNAKPHVIGLKHVEALTSIEGGRIGAGVKLIELARDPSIQEHFPVISEVAQKIASVLIQEQATIGGNLMLDTRCHFFNQSYFWRRSLGYCLKADGDLCHVVPKIKRDGEMVDNRLECFATNSSDLLPVLITLGASFELVSSEGTRTVKASEFYRHDGIERFVKRPGELLTAIIIPEEAKSFTAGYKKLRPRESWDFPVLGVAASLRTNDAGELEHLSISVNAVDTYPLVFDDVCQGLVDAGMKLDAAAIDELAEHVRDTCQPKLNVPMEPGYRKKMAGVFTRRLLTELAGL